MTTLKDRKPATAAESSSAESSSAESSSIESSPLETSSAESSPTAVIDSPSTLTVTHSADTPKLPSRLRRAGRFVARHPRWVQAFLLLALTSGTGCFLLYSLFKGAWTPERDNLTILQTIFKMEIKRDSTRIIDGDPQQVVTRSYQSLEPYMAEDGWIWINRFGSTITYGNQNKRLIASCSPYSPLYMVCSLSEIP